MPNYFQDAVTHAKQTANQFVDEHLLDNSSQLFRMASTRAAFPEKVEQTYHGYRDYQFLKGNHQLVMFGLAVFGSFLPSDIVIYQDISYYPFISRALVILTIVAVYFFVLKLKKIQHLPNIALLLCSLGTFQALTGASVLQEANNNLFMVGTVMFLMYGVCLFRFMFNKLAIYIAITLGSYGVFLISFADLSFLNEPLIVALQNVKVLILIMLLVISAIGLYTSWVVEKLQRKEWLQKQISNLEVKKQDKLVLLLQKRAWTDGLTKVYNRRFFDKKLNKKWQWHADTKLPLSVIMLDIDWFKLFNDNYGHQRGDICLKLIAKEVHQAVGAENLAQQHELNAFLSRYGGEEFIILLPETDHKRALAFANKVCQRIFDKNIQHDYSPLGFCSASLGVATVTPSMQDKDIAMAQLIKKADDALYLAKKRGKNQVCSMLDLPTSIAQIVAK